MTDAHGASPAYIEIRGAREHNLADLSLRIPRDQLVVVTGLSGSGKSSLAFDTLYAEGQRRYVESLSAYARQFLEQLAKPDVDAIEGLSPAIAIEQKSITRNPRSTVGTITEIYDYLRLLFARVGTPHCWQCGLPISSQTVQQMTDRIEALDEDTRLQILAPIVRDRKGEYKKELETFRSQGFVRARIDGELRDLSDDIELAKSSRHTIEVVIDRLVVKPGTTGRIAESLETALGLGEGLVLIDIGPGDEEWLLSEHNACVDCGVSFPEIAPRMFSFNGPHGACPDCSGIGSVPAFDAALVVPDPGAPLEKAIAPWTGRQVPRYYASLLASLAAHYKVTLDTPWSTLPAKVQRAILHGSGKEEVPFELVRDGKKEAFSRRWDGVLGELRRRLEEKGESAATALGHYQSEHPCAACEGSRLRIEARSVRIGEDGIHSIGRHSIEGCLEWAASLDLDPSRATIAERILKEIRERLHFLIEVGLDYLTLDRASTTLSGGEGQRIRLATQVGSSLMGVLYILDEPSIGLHPRDNQRLLSSLLRLRDLGNSVVVVEHDEETIRAADHVIDMGPGAGIHGGHITASGTPLEIEASPDSLTGAYLSGRASIAVPAKRRKPGEKCIALEGCSEHNLDDVSFTLPLGLLTVVTGVSGSGKSTLVTDTLYRVLAAHHHNALARPGAYQRISGVDLIDKVIDVSQAAIGRTPRSNPATYTGILDGIRKLFSQVPEARVRGYAPGRFSFNVKGGRCEACQGDGTIRVEMHFLPDIYVTCEVCGGKRYNRETLEITYKGRNIAQVLDMTVEEALTFMENVGAVRRPLQTLRDVGLDYIHLGQAATTLSGGEAQRIKLARELSRQNTGRTLYVLDEPTTGLHFADVDRLMGVLAKLVDLGNTVLIIEHNLDVIKQADYVVDLGPDGGARGGRILAQGTPEEVARHPDSHTGRALASVLPQGESP